MRVILASNSPRRKELIKRIFNSYDVVTLEIDERKIEERIFLESEDKNMLNLSKKISMELSKIKGYTVYEYLDKPKDTLIISADTSVALFDEILGKPKSKDDAIRMLEKESMYPQYVITGVTLIYNDNISTFYEETKVIFKKLDEAQKIRIRKYCETDEPYDKAGAYGIQDESDDLVEGFIGDYDNIVGFPVKKIKEEIKKMGIIVS